MSTLTVVEEVLRTIGAPISVREIVERAGARLPSKSKTPDTVVARDLAMDIKRQGEASRFVRTSPGRYTLRELVAAQQPAAASAPIAVAVTPLPASMAGAGLKQDRAPAKPARAAEPARTSLRGPASSSAG
jgi:hypothetical protein